MCSYQQNVYVELYILCPIIYQSTLASSELWCMENWGPITYMVNVGCMIRHSRSQQLLINRLQVEGARQSGRAWC